MKRWEEMTRDEKAETEGKIFKGAFCFKYLRREGDTFFFLNEKTGEEVSTVYSGYLENPYHLTSKFRIPIIKANRERLKKTGELPAWY